MFRDRNGGNPLHRAAKRREHAKVAPHRQLRLSEVHVPSLSQGNGTSVAVEHQSS
jgi:hypothetical protein